MSKKEKISAKGFATISLRRDVYDKIMFISKGLHTSANEVVELLLEMVSLQEIMEHSTKKTLARLAKYSNRKPNL